MNITPLYELSRYKNIEAMSNEALRIALQAPTPDMSLQVVLEYIGKALKGERTYIFEQNEHGGDDNTYEWTAVGVEPAGANCMQASFAAGKVTTLPTVNTIADGTAVKTPGSQIFPYIQKNLDDIITVTDDELIVSFLDMVENHKMIVENSGLLTVAALKHLNVKDKRVVSILSGGNMDVITMSSVVQQGLIFRDRIFTVSVLLPDKPGELAKVSETLAKEQGNVIKLEHNQFVSTNRNAAVELRITLECFGTDHKKRIIKALEKAGYKPKIVRTMI